MTMFNIRGSISRYQSGKSDLQVYLLSVKSNFIIDFRSLSGPEPADQTYLFRSHFLQYFLELDPNVICYNSR